MGLPIWVDPSEQKSSTCHTTAPTGGQNPKPPSDLTSNARASRSIIRRSVRYPPSSRTGRPGAGSLSQRYLYSTLRSPPPPPPERAVPPVPGSQDAQQAEGAGPEIVVLPSEDAGQDEDTSPARPGDSGRSSPWLGAGVEPFTLSDFINTDYAPRPRSRRGTITNERPTASPSAIDELPPLRRMGERSITARSPPPPPPRLVPSHDHGLRPSERYRFETAPAAPDRGSTTSPEADHWDTLFNTITPDPSLPSESTSFNSAPTTSFNHHGDRTRTHNRALRPLQSPLPPQPAESDSPPPSSPECPEQDLFTNLSNFRRDTTQLVSASRGISLNPLLMLGPPGDSVLDSARDVREAVGAIEDVVRRGRERHHSGMSRQRWARPTRRGDASARNRSRSPAREGLDTRAMQRVEREVEQSRRWADGLMNDVSAVVVAGEEARRRRRRHRGDERRGREEALRIDGAGEADDGGDAFDASVWW